MKFKIYYCVFLIGCLLFPQMILVEPVSLRHLLAAGMLLWLIVEKEFCIDNFIKAILCFVFCLGLSSFVTGYGSVFMGKALGTYLVGVVFYLASSTMIRRNGLLWFYFAFMSLMILDSIVTIGQFFNNPIAGVIAQYLDVMKYQEQMWESLEAHQGAIGGIGAGGLFGPVRNGYLLCVASILALYNKTGKITVWNCILCIVMCVSLFFTQERAGLFMGAWGIATYVFLNTQRHRHNFITILIVCFVTTCFFINQFDDYVDFENTRYGIQGLSLGGREELNNNTFNYVLINPLGGAYDWILGKHWQQPHNFWANCYLYGGIIGGSILLMVIIKQIYKTTFVLCKSFKHHNVSMSLVSCSLIYLALIAQSATHNNSLPTGDELFYLFWGIEVTLYSKEFTKRRSAKLRYLTI